MENNYLNTWVKGVTMVDWYTFIDKTVNEKLPKDSNLITESLSEGWHTQKIIIDNYDTFVKKYGDVFVNKEDFKKYLRIQKLGLYNMYDPMARKSTGLSEKKYSNIMKNYELYMHIYNDAYSKIMEGN